MKRALCVGINNYPGVDNDLQGCVNDCLDWSNELKRRGFQVQELMDRQASKGAIVDVLERLVQETGADDLLVFTFSGHGTWVPDEDGDEADGRDEALCPWDIGTTGAVITDDELYQLFSEKNRGARIVVLSDSCHSGSVTRFAPPVPGWSGHRKIRFLSPLAFKSGWSERALERAAMPVFHRHSRSASVLISGCKPTEYSYDSVFNGRPNGAFTYVALKALAELEGPMGAKPVTYSEWYKRIRAMLPSQSAPQTPTLDASSSQRRWTVFSD